MAPLSERLVAATYAVMRAHEKLIEAATLIEVVIGENPRTSERSGDSHALMGLMWVAGELPLLAQYRDAQANLKKALAVWTALLPTNKLDR